MENKVLKETLRGKGKPNRNNERQLVPVANLWATCVGEKIIVGWAKRHAELDPNTPYTGEYIAEGRAYTLDHRLDGWGLRVDEHGFTFVDPTRYDPKTTGMRVERTFPYVIQKALPAFLVRCEKYFKQGKLTNWAALVRASLPA
jgi:hypothetical protein